MEDIAATLDAYLSSQFGVTLERALADATADLCSLALRGAVQIACDPVGRFEYDDAGVSEQFQGLIDAEGVIYRFRCSVFTTRAARAISNRSASSTSSAGACGW